MASRTPITRRPDPAQTTASDAIRYGAIHLDVGNLENSLRFWGELIGLQTLQRSDSQARLGVEDAELLVLHAGATRRASRGHSGLYHLAIHLPSEEEFARVLARLFAARYPNAPTDHLMHWATYLDDPDGIGLELSFETLDRFGRWVIAGGRPAALDRDGQLREGTAPLDLEEVLSHLQDRDFNRPLAPASRIGHIHLHVAEIDPAIHFYEALGFSHGITMPFGMAELSAGGSFPHRLALNIWQGVGAPPPPAGTSGLRHAELLLSGEAELQTALERVRALGAPVLEEDGQAAIATDPAGNRVRLRASSQLDATN